jgi:thiosulfate/3-mercaptopyruvate sulfurtransferase
MLGVIEDESSTDGPDKNTGHKSAGFLSRIGKTAWTLALIFAMVSCASADDDLYDTLREDTKSRWDCPACRGEETFTLDIYNFLGHDFDDNTASEGLSPPQLARAAMESEADRSDDGFVHDEFLASLEEAEVADVILDVGSDYATSHIKGAIPLYWDELLDEENNPKPAAEMAEIFGNAGISPEDSVVIYGSCEPCDGISVAPFVFWALRYVGHDDVRVLDGGLEEWRDAGKATEKKANERTAVTYEPRVRSGLLADYEGVSSGEYQLVDARTLQEFAADKIQGAIHIDYDEVLAGGRMKSGEELADVFAGLDDGEKTAVYSNAGARAAMVSFALQLMGYESSIYTWNDWEANSPAVKAVLKGARADPNPARPGTVKIYATFDVVPDEADSETELFATETFDEEAAPEEPAIEDSSTVTEAAEEAALDDDGSNETEESIVSKAEIEEMISVAASSLEEPTAKTMGCVACFDPVALYASGSNPSEIVGGVKLGSVGSTSLAPITAAGALIQDLDGEIMATIELASTMSDEYVGTWDATGVADGVYTVTLAAAAGGKTSYFEDVLTIEIDSSAPVQETETTSSTSTGIRKLGSY